MAFQILAFEFPRVPRVSKKEHYQKAWEKHQTWIERCAKAVGVKYGWNAEKCCQVAHETFKALCAKDVVNDQMSCSLPPELDLVWHELILNTLEYAQMCHSTFEKFLHHTTTTVDDPLEVKQKRVDVTLAVCLSLFGEVKPWSMETRIVERTPVRPSSRLATKRRKRHTFKEIHAESVVYPFRVKIMTGEITLLYFSPHMTILDAQFVYSDMTQTNVAAYRWVHAGRVLDPKKTFADFNMRQDALIHLVGHLRGC